jgi:hypothetical protein
VQVAVDVMRHLIGAHEATNNGFVSFLPCVNAGDVYGLCDELCSRFGGFLLHRMS